MKITCIEPTCQNHHNVEVVLPFGWQQHQISENDVVYTCPLHHACGQSPEINSRPQINDINEIGLIAAILSENYLKLLSEFNSENNLNGYIGSAAQISEYAHEFYCLFDDKTSNWEEFEKTEDNIYDACAWDEFLICWGSERIKKYLIEKGENDPETWFQKYYV